MACILILLMCLPALAVPSLNLGPTTVNGSTVSFPVTLAGTQGSSISGIDFYIIFNRTSNPYSFAFKSITKGPALAVGKGINHSVSGGVLHIAVIGIDNVAISDGIIAQVSFDIISAATSNDESFVIDNLYISATDSNSMPVTITGSGTPAPPTSQLTVTLAGNGDGSLNSVPSGLACTGGSCSANFYAGSTVTIMPTAAVGSTFGQWTGDCNENINCAVRMTANRSATASFALSNAVRVGTNYYGTLNSAYSSALKDLVMQSRDVTFTENLDLSLGAAVTLAGGYGPTFQSRPGYTIIDGTLTISSGSLVADRLMLQ